MEKKDKVVLFDGAAGSLLWSMAEEKGIKRVSTWKYNIEAPELVFNMHKKYIEAGADMIQTNTFAVNKASVARESSYSVKEVVAAAVDIAMRAAEGTGVEVYLSSGPLTDLLEPFGNLSEEECADCYREIISVAVEKGVKTVLLETFMDLEMMKIAATVAKELGVKVICSLTFEARHRTMMGNSVAQICADLEEIGVDAVGMNCSKGPAESMEIIKEFSETTDLSLFFKPNTGMGVSYGPLQFADEIAPALSFVSYVGGCCGTDEQYIKELRKRIDALA